MPDNFDWIDSTTFAAPDAARDNAQQIWQLAVPRDLLVSLKQQLVEQLPQLDDADATLDSLASFLAAGSAPELLLELFRNDARSLPSLLKIFATSPRLTKHLVHDPDFFQILRQQDGQVVDRSELVDRLYRSMSEIEDFDEAAAQIRSFLIRETSRIIYGEFARSMVPEKVGRQLTYVADAVVQSSLDFLLRYLPTLRDTPVMPSGNTPQVTLIGLGSFGAEEMSYGDSLQLIFLYDRIDPWNITHREYYDLLVSEFIRLLHSDTPIDDGYNIDLRQSPMYETGTRICSSFEAARIFETSGRTWQRLGFIKARVVAGSQSLGEGFLTRLQPWIFRRFISRSDLAEIQTLQHKLERRTLTPSDAASSAAGQKPCNVLRAPGGRGDIQRTIQFLQLLHGDRLPEVRHANTYDALIGLERAGCVTHEEASLLSENHARLCRLQHQIAVMFEKLDDQVPIEPAQTQRLAWQLGIRDSTTKQGDVAKFRKQLEEVFDVNCRMINHLMLDAPDDGSSVAIETELMLDPDPAAETITQVLSKHGLTNAARAFEDLIALSTESVPFLSPHRCRHFFAQIVPSLLSEISQTPHPDKTLASLTRVADSIGAKATLWELLGTNRPTMKMVVRLCAAAPYLVEILTDNPGMIDELIDSLLMDRLPSAERLDSQSIELCRGAQEIDAILHSFKQSAHLTIGVRNILGKETLAATQQAIGDTAEACIRRIIEFEQERLAAQYGDPVTEEGEKAEMIAVALGKLGGREPNYHSDLDVVFLYSADGETCRRVGGPRSTTTNRSFFNQLAQRVIERINAPGPKGRMYELDGRLRPTGEEGVFAMSTEDFLNRFRQHEAPLWQWLAICKARSISGSRTSRTRFDNAIASLLPQSPWTSGTANEIRKIRTRMQETATSGNLKRGEGGTVDVEFVAQMMTLKHAADSPKITHCNTTISLERLAEAGHLPEDEALQLIAGYQTLRGVEINLRLMKTPHRHALPELDSLMKNLAFLMNENDPKMIQTACDQARQRNRRLFNRIFDRA
ncbi:glutamate-ammonia ligase adenylyltransferase [Rhodopirellula maiorica SM1]|uniref:Glutamate-ammonia ligase adenylyltransferase n=1 Tax=Rhodopirellula maiorica SM1 TaxID=1265738 RepID=M5RPQ1_9BACT|nr:[glutamate--ammonia-ligase] adenylyltransferase [Rhodopirellula maiorica]EMI17352.1 glutamate-ammonia ligase adenylyltransferase [Rhodopirellula maiorica SM1]